MKNSQKMKKYQALYPYLPMERMAEKDRYMLDI